MSRRRNTRGGNNDADAEEQGQTIIHSEERKQLLEELGRMDDDILQEKRELNKFQQQKDKIEKFWLMEKETRDDLIMQLRNKIRQKQDLDEKHAFEIKVYQKKVKHLLHEQQAQITDVLYEGQVALKLLQDDNRQIQHELKTNIRSIKVIMKHMEVAHNDLKKSIRQKYEKQIMHVRQEYERKAEEMRRTYEEKMKAVREHCDKIRKRDTNRLENRKKKHIQKLMKDHKEKFQNIQRYYRDITSANLDSIKQLKGDVGESKQKEKELEKDVRFQEREHQRLIKPLVRNQLLHDQLEKDKKNFISDAKTLETTKQQMSAFETKRDNLSWEHEILEQKLIEKRKEKKALSQKLEATIYDLQQKTGFKNLILEKKLEALAVDLQKTESALAEVIASTMQGESGQHVKNSLEDVLMVKNQQVQRLQRRLAELKQTYHDAIVKYEKKLREYDIPLEELGFTPVKRF